MKRNRPDRDRMLDLCRFAIRKSRHHRGIGTALLNGTIWRPVQAAEITGITVLLANAISEQTLSEL